MPNETKIHHCIRCGRVLKDKKSIASGLGPECREKAPELDKDLWYEGEDD